VSITSPTNGATLSTGNVAITASAVDNSGGSGVKRVEFYVESANAIYLGQITSSTSTYTYNWNTAAYSGSQKIYAIAYDNAGNTKESMHISVTISPPANTVTISGPTVTSITQTTAVVSWTTNIPADTQTSYTDPAGTIHISTKVTTLSTSHSVTLAGLSPNTLYIINALSSTGGTSAKSSDTQLLTLPQQNPSGAKFRNAIFYHHSVGDYLYRGYAAYGASVSQVTSVPNEIQKYNAAHAGSGWTNVAMAESFKPDGSDNNWDYWDSELSSHWSTYVTNQYPVVIIKTCYIQGQITYTDSDLTASEAHYRSIIRMMGNDPTHFFVIWVDYPSGSGGANVHLNALKFAQWAKDVLAQGNDPQFGVFPKNVYVFDELRIIANPTDGTIPADYYFTGWMADSGVNHYGVTWDDEDHPSPYAVNAIDPKFVQETFDATRAYEQTLG